MTDETDNLVLELLRGMRADMDGLRREIADLRGEIAALSERMDGIETQLRGATYIMTVSVGSLLAKMENHDTRIVKLEGKLA